MMRHLFVLIILLFMSSSAIAVNNMPFSAILEATRVDRDDLSLADRELVLRRWDSKLSKQQTQQLIDRMKTMPPELVTDALELLYRSSQTQLAIKTMVELAENQDDPRRAFSAIRAGLAGRPLGHILIADARWLLDARRLAKAWSSLVRSDHLPQALNVHEADLQVLALMDITSVVKAAISLVEDQAVDKQKIGLSWLKVSPVSDGLDWPAYRVLADSKLVRDDKEIIELVQGLLPAEAGANWRAWIREKPDNYDWIGTVASIAADHEIAHDRRVKALNQIWRLSASPERRLETALLVMRDKKNPLALRDRAGRIATIIAEYQLVDIPRLKLIYIEISNWISSDSVDGRRAAMELFIFAEPEHLNVKLLVKQLQEWLNEEVELIDRAYAEYLLVHIKSHEASGKRLVSLLDTIFKAKDDCQTCNKALAITVMALEEMSGQSYGQDLKAWQKWARKQKK